MKSKDESNVITRFRSKGIFPHQFAFTLLIPLRNIFLSPNQLVGRLELEENFNVLEIGPGPGYFSIKVAQCLPKGSLVLADIQEEMLQYAKKRIERKGLKNVEYKLCNGEGLEFESSSFDRVFMVTVLGEVERKEIYIRDIHRILKKGGILSISESVGDPDKMSIEELKRLIIPKGFEFSKHFGNRKNYTINFLRL